MFKLWSVDLGALQSAEEFKQLNPQERERALSIAKEISLELSSGQLIARFGKKVSKGSYEVKHTSDSGYQIETKLDDKVDTILLLLKGESLLLKSAQGELLLK